MVLGLLTDVADAGQLRRDVAPEELAIYYLHALGADRLVVAVSRL